MRVSSAKQKGRRFQQYVRDCLLKLAGSQLEEDDIKSTSMGASGEDVQLSPAARKIFPWTIECKNVEKLSVWSAIEQNDANNKVDRLNIVVFKKNNKDAQITLKFEEFLKIYEDHLMWKSSIQNFRDKPGQKLFFNEVQNETND